MQPLLTKKGRMTALEARVILNGVYERATGHPLPTNESNPAEIWMIILAQLTVEFESERRRVRRKARATIKKLRPAST